MVYRLHKLIQLLVDNNWYFSIVPHYKWGGKIIVIRLYEGSFDPFPIKQRCIYYSLLNSTVLIDQDTKEIIGIDRNEFSFLYDEKDTSVKTNPAKDRHQEVLRISLHTLIDMLFELKTEWRITNQNRTVNCLTVSSCTASNLCCTYRIYSCGIQVSYEATELIYTIEEMVKNGVEG